MPDAPTEKLADVAAYYSSRLAEHGPSARGVDWNGEESQRNRFDQLCKIIDRPDAFSIADLGCGYGAFFDFLAERYSGFHYEGIDISESMVEAARQRIGAGARVRFSVADKPSARSDFCVASGIFNVRLDRKDADWLPFIEQTIEVMDASSARGFAFNCLTAYSDRDKMRDYLYYADPAALFDLCKRKYSRNVALLHDYGLYEFTILVRKNP